MRILNFSSISWKINYLQNILEGPEIFSPNNLCTCRSGEDTKHYRYSYVDKAICFLNMTGEKYQYTWPIIVWRCMYYYSLSLAHWIRCSRSLGAYNPMKPEYFHAGFLQFHSVKNVMSIANLWCFQLGYLSTLLL